MKLWTSVMVISVLSTVSNARPMFQSYWLLYNEQAHEWCSYSDEGTFQKEAETVKPLESARVKLLSGKFDEITLQVQPESGDWVAADKYDFSSGEINLKRVIIFTQSQIEVSQEARLNRRIMHPLRLISAKTLDGRIVSAEKIDLPNIPVRTSLRQFPFIDLVKSMNARPRPVGCAPDVKVH
jgi:hypothetical protein